jgi:hypothetical protein
MFVFEIFVCHWYYDWHKVNYTFDTGFVGLKNTVPALFGKICYSYFQLEYG